MSVLAFATTVFAQNPVATQEEPKKSPVQVSVDAGATIEGKPGIEVEKIQVKVDWKECEISVTGGGVDIKGIKFDLWFDPNVKIEGLGDFNLRMKIKLPPPPDLTFTWESWLDAQWIAMPGEDGKVSGFTGAPAGVDVSAALFKGNARLKAQIGAGGSWILGQGEGEGSIQFGRQEEASFTLGGGFDRYRLLLVPGHEHQKSPWGPMFLRATTWNTTLPGAAHMDASLRAGPVAASATWFPAIETSQAILVPAVEEGFRVTGFEGSVSAEIGKDIQVGAAARRLVTAPVPVEEETATKAPTEGTPTTDATPTGTNGDEPVPPVTTYQAGAFAEWQTRFQKTGFETRLDFAGITAGNNPLIVLADGSITTRTRLSETPANECAPGESPRTLDLVTHTLVSRQDDGRLGGAILMGVGGTFKPKIPCYVVFAQKHAGWNLPAGASLTNMSQLRGEVLVGVGGPTRGMDTINPLKLPLVITGSLTATFGGGEQSLREISAPANLPATDELRAPAAPEVP